MTKKQHAKLSASGSERWLNCPGSVKAEEPYVRQSNIYADEGSLAHEIADFCLKKRKEANFYLGKSLQELGIEIESFAPSHTIDSDMVYHVQQYLDYVLSFETNDSLLFSEEKVNFSNIVPDGFGTNDAAILIPSKRELHIFDLKYGRGVKVDAFKNTQAQLYAIGFINEIGFLNDFDKIIIHICQPRLYSFDTWETNLEELLQFSKWAAERAKLALTKNAPRVAGENQCKWCAAKGECKTLMNFTENLITQAFEDLHNSSEDLKMSYEDKKRILDNKDLINDFINAVEKSVYDTLSSGEKFDGYKLVEGRANRVFADNAELVLVEHLGDEAYTKKLIGIGEADKKLPKHIVESITYKPKGKLTLVKDTDRRKAVDVNNVCDIISQFDSLINSLEGENQC